MKKPYEDRPDYYFAYGSNMDENQMADRVGKGNFEKICVAKLEGYRFAYDGKSQNWDNKAVANIIKSNGDVVWGVLYKVGNNRDKFWQSLDGSEGYREDGSGAYSGAVVEVLGEDGKTYKAWTYLRKEPAEPGEPSERYRKQIIKAAYHHGLPEEYIEEYL